MAHQVHVGRALVRIHGQYRCRLLIMSEWRGSISRPAHEWCFAHQLSLDNCPSGIPGGALAKKAFMWIFCYENASDSSNIQHFCVGKTCWNCRFAKWMILFPRLCLKYQDIFPAAPVESAPTNIYTILGSNVNITYVEHVCNCAIIMYFQYSCRWQLLYNESTSSIVINVFSLMTVNCNFQHKPQYHPYNDKTG